MKNKKIMFFGWLFYPKVGGAETILLNQAKELLNRGYQVSILTSVLEDKKEKDEKIFGIKIFRRKYINSQELQDEQLINNDLSKIINKTKVDIFHFHNGSYPSGSKDKSIGTKNILAIYKTVKKFNIPIIEHAHNAQLKDPNSTKALRDLHWDCLICVSDFVSQEWKKLGTKAKLIKTIYNGIDTELFSKTKANEIMVKIKEKNKVVLFSPARLLSLTTGELNKQKNLKLVFDALGILIKRGINNFVLISIFNDVYGDEIVKKAKDKIDKIIKEKNLKEKVVFIPVINPNKMPSFYAGTDIVCVPALYETFGLMYLEAMAAGKIIIASNTGGPKEYIKNNKNGYFVDPKNQNELANLLEILIKDKKLRQKIGKKAKKDSKKFSIKSMVDEIEIIYKNL
jgi:glycosyltransferase involved in cell wall biosynthesis